MRQHACLTRRATIGILLGSAAIRGASAAGSALLNVSYDPQSHGGSGAQDGCGIDLSRAKV